MVQGLARLYRIRLEGEEVFQGLHWEEPPDVAAPLLRDLARLAVVCNLEVVMVLVLEVLDNVHQMDVGLLDVKVQRVHLLESMDGLQVEVVRLRDAQLFKSKIDVSDARVGLEPLFVLADPETTLHLKVIVGEEHPAELGDELKGVADVVDVFIVEEVAEVESGVAHFDDFKALVNGAEVDISQLVVYSQQLESVHAGA